MSHSHYPQDFIEAVKAAYPTMTELHNLLEKNAYVVGTFLDVTGRESIKPEKILAMIDDGKIAELRLEAMQKVTQRKLYDWWFDIQESRRD